MEIKRWFWTAVSCLALTLWALPAAAAPISGATTELKLAANGNSIVEATHWRRRYAHYYSEYSSDNFDRYYPYEEPSYRYYSYGYPSYHYYDVYPVYPRYDYTRHNHHRHYRDYRRW